MFAFASSFDRPIDSWRVDNVADTSLMFFGASAFNQPLSEWRIESVARRRAAGGPPATELAGQRAGVRDF